MPDTLKQTILNLAQPLVEAQGLDIWGLDIVGGPTLKVCLYIDAPHKEGLGNQESATIDQCEEVSRQLGLALDVEDCIENHWVLEVSSPGLERKFFSAEQMRPYVGDVVDCTLFESPEGFSNRKTFRGRLLAVDNDFFDIEPCAISAEGKILQEGISPVRIYWANVRNARRVHIFIVPCKPGKKSSKNA